MGEGRRAHPEMQGVWGSGLSSPVCMALSLEGPERRGPQTRGALAWPGHQPAPRCAGRGGVATCPGALWGPAVGTAGSSVRLCLPCRLQLTAPLLPCVWGPSEPQMSLGLSLSLRRGI